MRQESTTVDRGQPKCQQSLDLKYGMPGMPQCSSVSSVVKPAELFGGSCRFVLPAPEILDQMLRSAQGERENANGGCFVGAVQEHARIANV